MKLVKRASKADKKAQKPLHVVIADASPLIALSLIDSLHRLGQLFGQVQVVRAVLAEVLPGAFNTSEQRIRAALQSGILTVVEDGEGAGAEDAGTLALQNVIQQAMLDAGEASSLVHALRLKQAGVSGATAPLLIMDERAGRQVAVACALPVVGTAALVVMAKERGVVQSAKIEFARLHAADFWISQPVLRVMLARCGET